MGTLPNGGVKCKGVWKKLQFPTNISILIARKRLKIDGYMLRCVWQALNPLFIHINLPRLSQGRTQGRPKCALGWLQKLTHVPLAIAILLVHSCWCCDCVSGRIQSWHSWLSDVSHARQRQSRWISSRHRVGTIDWWCWVSVPSDACWRRPATRRQCETLRPRSVCSLGFTSVTSH